MLDIRMTIYADRDQWNRAPKLRAWVASEADSLVTVITDDVTAFPWFHVDIWGRRGVGTIEVSRDACEFGATIARLLWHEAFDQGGSHPPYEVLDTLLGRLRQASAQAAKDSSFDGIQGGIDRAGVTATLATLEQHALTELAIFFNRRYRELEDEYYREYVQPYEEDSGYTGDPEEMMRMLGLSVHDFF